ncbi:MAG: hypothetical protein ACM3X6_11560, partial [Patescibacteria group bacterium]
QVAGYTGDREARAWLAWLPLRDMLSALVWIAGAFGLRVSWRGEEFVLSGGGRMRPLGEICRSRVRSLKV